MPYAPATVSPRPEPQPTQPGPHGPAMDDDEFAAWFHVVEAPGVGRQAARRLLAALGSPQVVLGAPASVLRELAGPAAATVLRSPAAALQARWQAALQWRHGGGDRFVLSLADPSFPPALLQTPDPPLLLYGQGQPSALAAPMLAIVGSRNATAQGQDNARQFAHHLSQQGWAVVSGLALGIDAAAHLGALDGGGSTIAVVATGLDIVYPRRHAALAQRIAARGAVLSEFAPGTPALGAHFPQRNRIIAGLARGTLVVEAAVASGSLITARQAADSGRDVFAIPGSIHSPLSRGCHALIRQGAKLVESAQDILDELPLHAASDRPAAACPGHEAIDTGRERDPVLRALGEDPVGGDDLGLRTGLPAGQLAARLMELELQGQVARLPGGRFQRRHAA